MALKIIIIITFRLAWFLSRDQRNSFVGNKLKLDVTEVKSSNKAINSSNFIGVPKNWTGRTIFLNRPITSPPTIKSLVTEICRQRALFAIKHKRAGQVRYHLQRTELGRPWNCPNSPIIHRTVQIFALKWKCRCGLCGVGLNLVWTCHRRGYF